MKSKVFSVFFLPSETNRVFNIGYCIFDYIFTLLFIAFLLKKKKMKELAFGLTAGTCMFIAEVILLSLGIRKIYNPPEFSKPLVILAIGFDPTLVAMVTTVSLIKYFYIGEDKEYVYQLVFLFLIGWLIFPLGRLLPFGFFQKKIEIVRPWPLVIHLIELMGTIIFFTINYWVLGLRRLTLVSFAVGCFVDGLFEGGMLLHGIRVYEGVIPPLLKFLLHATSELNFGIMTSIFVLSRLKYLPKSKFQNY